MSRRPKTRLDFSAYRTPELSDTIFEIISLPNAARAIIKWGFVGLIVLMIAAFLFLKLTGNAGALWMLLFELYSIPTGFIGGLALGIAEFIRRSLGNMTKLVDLLLATTAQIADDLVGLASGDKEIPSPADLVDDVYHEVFLPVLKKVMFSAFGFLGRPIYVFYHLTLNQLVRIVISRFVSDEQIQPTEQIAGTIAMVGDVTDEKNPIVSSLRWTQSKFNHVSGWLKVLVMFPCYSILAVIVVAILTPILIMSWLFFSGADPQPEAIVSMICPVCEFVQALSCHPGEQML